MSEWALGLAFLGIGLLSALIGLGGGTSYLAFMDLFQLPAAVIPVIALLSNVLVSAVGSAVRLYRREAIPWKIMAVCLGPSMLLAWLGASLRIAEPLYRLLLNTGVLLLLALRLLKHLPQERDFCCRSVRDFGQLFLLSGAIGFVSGIIGIGGGIILGPVLHFRGMPYERIPVITAIYIFLNSMVGLLAHAVRLPALVVLAPFWYLPLIPLFTSLAAMFCLAWRISSSQIKTIVTLMIALIALYNLFRLFHLPGGIKIWHKVL